MSELYEEKLDQLEEDFGSQSLKDNFIKLNLFWETYKDSDLVKEKIAMPCEVLQDPENEFKTKQIQVSYYNVADNVLFPDLKKLYVRALYDSLFNDLAKRKGGTLTGSPGIGKSTFILYCLKRFYEISVQENRELVLVIIKGFSQQQYFLYTRSFCAKIELSIFKTLRSRPEVILLVDQKYSDSCEEFVGKIYLFASPNRENSNEIEKLYLTRLYMPTWSLDELYGLNEILNRLPFSEINERFRIAGGKPRFIFSKNFEAIESEISIYIIRQTHQEKNCNFLLELADKVTQIEGKVVGLPFKLTSFTCDVGDFENYRIELASEWIKETIKERFLSKKKHNWDNFFKSSSIKYYRELCGPKFKDAAINALIQGGSFPMKQYCYLTGAFYKDKEQLYITFPENASKRSLSFDFLNQNLTQQEEFDWLSSSEVTRSTILLPRKCKELGLDAFSFLFGGLQMTVAARCGFPENSKEKLKFLCGSLGSRLMFVVPEENLEHFKFSGFTVDGKKAPDQQSDIVILVIGINSKALREVEPKDSRDINELEFHLPYAKKSKK